MPRGQRITSKEKRIVHRVWTFFKEESEKDARDRIGVQRVLDPLHAATGFSKQALCKIKREFKESGTFSPTPKKAKRYSVSRLVINVDDFDRSTIRQTLHGFYERKEYPTLISLLKIVREEGIFNDGKSTLAKLLKLIGFKYTKRNDKKYFYERKDIVDQRHRYLREIRKYRRMQKSKSFFRTKRGQIPMSHLKKSGLMKQAKEDGKDRPEEESA